MPQYSTVTGQLYTVQEYWSFIMVQKRGTVDPWDNAEEPGDEAEAHWDDAKEHCVETVEYW